MLSSGRTRSIHSLVGDGLRGEKKESRVDDPPEKHREAAINKRLAEDGNPH